MKIGFDAKRAFHNGTGLGHYSRTLLNSLATYYPSNEYYLFNPKPSDIFELSSPSFHEILPRTFLDRLFPSYWRSSRVTSDITDLKLDLYHGLSHEIPVGIKKTAVPSVVTMHDLIHERYPEQYNAIDVKIYSKKFRYAAHNADHIIAISEQTKLDLINFYKTPPGKITVCYQSCNPAFGRTVSEEEKQRIRLKYDLPEKFFLYVGSIIERKNLLNIAKAFFLLRNETDSPLVVIGEGGKYLQQVKDYIHQNDLENKILFLSSHPVAAKDFDFRSARDFPAIYQSATAMIYPSRFEGFGIPVLEALWSRLPVITSNVSCLPEAGGPGAYYVDPNSADEIAISIRSILNDNIRRQKSIQQGWEHAQNFTQEKCATAVMNVYKKIISQ